MSRMAHDAKPTLCGDIEGYREGLLRSQIGIEANRCFGLLSNYQALLAYARRCFQDCSHMLENALIKLVMATRGKDDRFDWANGFASFSLLPENGDRQDGREHLRAESFVDDMRARVRALCLEEKLEGHAELSCCLDRMLSLECEIAAACKGALSTASYYADACNALLGSRLVSLIRRLPFFTDRKFSLHVEMQAFPESISDFVQNPFTGLLVSDLSRDGEMLPRSNGSLARRADTVIGLASDEFAYLNYKDCLHVMPVNMENRDALLTSGVDALICTSCWYGIALGPHGVISLRDFDGDKGVENLIAIVKSAKERGIPTLFQSFEDPPSYERFLPVAQAVDAVFTTAEECIAGYEDKTDAGTVKQVGFGINPLIHNPIGMTKRILVSRESKRVLFAGAWYEKFEQRCLDTRMMFDGVIACENVQFVCIDRNLGAHDPLRTFPCQYNAFLHTPIGYEELQALSKEFDWVLNLNSVTVSSTMCARRVYELQAIGALVISNYSKAISRLFPSVFTVFSSEEIRRIIDGYTEEERLSIQIEQVRDVLSNHTNEHRLAYMLGSVGIMIPVFSPKVLVLCDMSDRKVVEDIARQTYRHYRIVDKAESPKGQASLYDFVIEWERPYENPYYLEDLVNVFRFVDVDYACYGSWEDLDASYDYVTVASAPLGSLMRIREVDSLHEFADEGPLHGFSILAERWGRRTSQDAKELAVIVPYHGEFESFHKRMFRSLLRLSGFSHMRIYVVDDREMGKCPDQAALEFLYRHYDNVRFAHSDEVESGLLEEDYVAVLLPSQEVVGDGLSEMLNLMKTTDASVVAGRVLDLRKSADDGFPRSREAKGVARQEPKMQVAWDFPCAVMRRDAVRKWDCSAWDHNIMAAVDDGSRKTELLDKVVAVRYSSIDD